MQVQSVPISTLVHDPQNSRIHDTKNIKAIMGSLTAFGQQKPIVVNKDNVVIAGNGTLVAAKELGWTSINVVKTDLPKREQKAFALADNKTSELAEWDDVKLDETLHELKMEDFDITSIGFDLDDGDIHGSGMTDDDAVPEVPQNIHNVQRGQIWKLGEHRLMCGDSTSKEDVERLMNGEKADLWLTDAPYGVSYADKNEFLNSICNGIRLTNRIENDHMSIEDMAIFWTRVGENAYFACSDKASYYWFACQGGDQMMMMMSLSQAEWKVRHELIWVKNNHVLGRCDYQYKHEPILYGWKKDGTHKYYGGFKTSVLEFDKPQANKLHPTMKPIELLSELVNNSSQSGELVFDSFLGSGSTLIACEKTNRKCYGCEIDPHYCSVIIERWQQYTGRVASLLTENLQNAN